MTPPASREGLPVMTEQLKPCPFCGNELYRSPRTYNPKAYCATEDCYGKRMSVVNLDDPIIVAMWNTRQAVNSYPEMREALLPFANLANCYDDELDPDDRPVGPVALKFCRAARKALATDREVEE